MKLLLSFACCALSIASTAYAQSSQPFEVHDRLIEPMPASDRDVAITLDACGGRYDHDLIAEFVAKHIPATIFVTKKWLDRNPVGTAELLAHPELFELEDHGAAHVPAVVGAGKRIYGLAAEPDLAHVRAEVTGGADAITQITGLRPRYFRGATAIYDASAIAAIRAMGYVVAGFSVNADAGASLPEAAIAARLRAVRPGDIVIAHMNKPAGATAEGFADALPELQARGYRFVKLSDVQLQAI